MICPLVFTSGAGTSLVGQICFQTASIYPLESLSNSVVDSFFGFTIIPHFPHPSGKSTTAVLKLIHAESDFTSSNDTFS
jgi:hypothetical protein